MNILMHPKQKVVLNQLSRLRLFEVCFDEDWSEVHHGEGINHQWSRSTLKNIKFDGKLFSANYPFTREEPNEEAAAELEALANLWRERGRNDFADALTSYWDDDSEDVVYMADKLTDTVNHVRKIEIENPKFLALRPWVGPIKETYMVVAAGRSLTREMLGAIDADLAMDYYNSPKRREQRELNLRMQKLVWDHEPTPKNL